MPSNSLLRWQRDARAELDDIVGAHAAVGGNGRGRRVATLQINHAYAVLLSSQFQRFCRDLHSEAIEHICNAVPTAWTRPILRARLTEGRKLDTGNPDLGNLGSDYKRLGIDLWPTMRALDARTDGRKAKLERLNRWRTAIAHQDFSDATSLDLGAGRIGLRLQDVRGWRAACDRLAETMDAALLPSLTTLPGRPPGSTVQEMPKAPPDLRPGDVVRFTLGAMTVHARVIEDRGHIGLGGRQLVRIEVLGEEDVDEPRRFEMRRPRSCWSSRRRSSGSGAAGLVIRRSRTRGARSNGPA